MSVAVQSAGMLLEQLSSGLVSKSKRLQKACPFAGSISTQHSSVGGASSPGAAHGHARGATRQPQRENGATGRLR